MHTDTDTEVHKRRQQNSEMSHLICRPRAFARPTVVSVVIQGVGRATTGRLRGQRRGHYVWCAEWRSHAPLQHESNDKTHRDTNSFVSRACTHIVRTHTHAHTYTHESKRKNIHFECIDDRRMYRGACCFCVCVCTRVRVRVRVRV